MTWRIPVHMAWVAPEASPSPETSVWVLNAQRNNIRAMSVASFEIWRAADGASNVAMIVDRLVEAHQWERETIAEPVKQHVELLMQQGLLEEASS